ncbi:hemerythrin domain-containing protein [Actinokineospora sp. UTMC 2448]|uniref:hemerythrin domain-containing protein n=1 Tax=Actinokineospora sp. UTMC 2448 TaxID=2268449 RepID=UPI00216474DE|nr:hemerythrin domain-containing protein [Actinokineospora sp. UTMC 2448]UVS78458.1 iron-sulfur cluster repair di-iron protein [Actinokineospora sp. UTMC 2448]
MSDKLDMTPMYAMHDALRRELEHLAKVTVRLDDPRRVLRAAVGWELFRKSLHVHHTAEDDALWPALRRTLADRPDDLALLEAMEAEHAGVDQLIEAIDAQLADPEAPLNGLGDLVDSLVTGLSGHLRHEEAQALPLIQAVATPQQWAHFGQVHGQRIGPDAPRLLPWLLEGASDETVATMLAPLPEPARAAFTAQWRPAYAALDRWGAA